MKALFMRYRHGLMFLYAFIYFPWFFHVEKTVRTDFHIIHMPIDDWIPFVEYFIVPYLMWFAYVSVTLIYLFFKDIPGFYRTCAYLFTGMTIFLIISTVYPNGHLLRPTAFARDNICVDMVRRLYAADTSTNIFPSIHVYNALVAHIAIAGDSLLGKKSWLRRSSLVLMVGIVLATVFLKQHSVFDVITGILLAMVLYRPVYKMDAFWLRLFGRREALPIEELEEP